MYIILTYDINEKRVARVLKVCRKYLTRKQNSVFEGEITEATLVKLHSELEKIVDDSEDQVLYYKFRAERYVDKEIQGLSERDFDMLLL